MIQTVSTPSFMLALLNTSVNQICKNNKYNPKGGTIRYHLQNPDAKTVQQPLNQMLKNNIPETLPHGPLTFNIDFTLIPFYGTEQNKENTTRSKARQITTRFFAYTPIYITSKNKKNTH